MSVQYLKSVVRISNCRALSLREQWAFFACSSSSHPLFLQSQTHNPSRLSQTRTAYIQIRQTLPLRLIDT